MEPSISIIIPVYNVKPYLKRCIESVLNQTFKDFELILVDDGSTDNSGEICDEYAGRDKRVVVIHQENAGQAHARNVALSHSNGMFILYADCDDYVCKDHVKAMVDLALEYNADIVQCSMKKFTKEKEIKDDAIGRPEFEIYTASAALEEYCYQRKFYPGPWCKIIRRELMDGLLFPSGTGYEDMAIMHRLLGRAEKIILLPAVLYYYRQHSSSTMHTKFSDKKIDRIRIAEQLKKYIEEYFPENIRAVKTRYFLANIQLAMDVPYSRQYCEVRADMKKNICSVRRDVMKDKKSKKTIRFMAAASYLGMPALMLLGRLYKAVFS